jgi:hypothetical protein
MSKTKITYDVGDFEYFRIRWGSLNSDAPRLRKETRIARLPFFDKVGLLGGWKLYPTIANTSALALLATFPIYWPFWLTMVFGITLRAYPSINRIRLSLMERDIVSILRLPAEDRSTKIAELLLSHQHYFAEATSDSAAVGSFVKHMRVLNWAEKVVAKLPVVMYAAGMGLLILYIASSIWILAFVSLALVFGGMLSLPMAALLSLWVNEQRRHIPPVWTPEDFGVAIAEKSHAEPEG